MMDKSYGEEKRSSSMDGGVSVQLVTEEEEEEEDMMEEEGEASTSPVQIIQGGGENHHHYHPHQKTTSPQCCSTCKNNNAGFLSSSLMKICSHCSTHHHSQEEKSGTWPTTKTEGGGGRGEIIIEGEEDSVANGVISGGGATVVVLDDQGPGSLCSDAEVEELLLPPRAGILSSVEEDVAAAAAAVAAGTAELIQCNSTVIDQDEIHAKNSMRSQEEEEEEQKNSMSHLCQLYKRGELGFGRVPLGAGSMMQQQQQQSHNNNNKQLNSITMDHENHHASSFSVEVGQEKEQQLSSSIGQVSQLRNLHVDSGVSDPDSFKDETTSPLPCCPQSQGVESSCIQSVSRQLNFQQVEFQDHNKAGSPPSLVAIGSGVALSCEDEDLWDEHEEDAGSTKVSSSLEENNNGSTHDYMCKICDKEFDGAKSLSLHKKTHPQYTLRRNPKRSRRFIDQDYAVEVSAAAAPAKKMSTMSEDKVKTCTECGKEFGSWKALFGHMRCHPEREWRGIQPPDTHQHGRMNNNASHPPSRRKKPPPNVIVTADSDSESETESRRGSRKASDNESDTESIEAAYMNGDMQQSVRNWQKGKRTKRLRQSVRSLQAVTSSAPENSEAATTPTETRHQREIIDALMLLKAVESERKRSALTAPPQEPQVTDKEDVVLHHWSGGKAEEVEKEDHVSRSEKNCHKEDKRSAIVKKEAEDAYPSEEDEDGANEFETGMQGVGPRMKYECTTCKRIFKSHQALGGHRASHKKVKGCYARTNVGEGGAQDQSPEEDITDDEAMNTENIELLPPYDIQDASHTSEQEDHKPCHYLAVAKDDNEEMFSIARKSKGHECSICHRVFNSGQALGGHKRCHWGGTTASTSAPSEPYSGIRTNNQQQMSALQTTLAGHHQVSNPKREVLERELDLNMPAPESDDFVEQVGSSSAHILPPSLGHSNSYIPLLSSPFFSMAKKYASSSPFQDSVEKRHHLPNNSRDQYGFQAKDMPSSVDDDNTPEQATASGGCKSETGSLGAGDQGLDNLQNFGQFGQSLKATCHNADVGPEPQVPLLLD